MRICVVSYHSSPLAPVGAGKSGGMSIVIRNLYSQMARFADIDIFVRGSENMIDVGPHIRLIQVERFDTDGFAEAIVKAHAAHKYDLMHTHYWLSGVIGLQLHNLLGIPWLHSLHTVEVLKTIRQDKARIEIEEEIIRSCDLVVSPTDQEATAIRMMYPEARVIAVPHGVDTAKFTPRPNGHKKILFVGRIDPIKGIHLLIEALRNLQQEISLTVVGGHAKGARDSTSIETYAAGLPVDFVGQVRHDDLRKYYDESAILVVPSYYESFGLVGLEAMASARPVVGFNHTGLQETVGSDAGILVDMGSQNLTWAIDLLMNDAGLRQRLGSQGRAKALKYDWSKIAHVYRGLYEETIEE
ncbi:MAG: glycosyltransferase [candidate division WOR-3 bacterium]|jgi:D-inositol-3-phosphate glycosyltransferase